MHPDRIAYLRTIAVVTQVQLRAVIEGLTSGVNKLSTLSETTRHAIAYSSSGRE